MSIAIIKPEEFKTNELDELCLATEDAIRDGIGFNWVSPPAREILEKYWKGVLMVPERVLFMGKLDGTVAASAQLVKPGPSKQLSAFAASLEAHFAAPWARGHGLARGLLSAVENEAKLQGFTILKLDVRASQEAAIHLYESQGYIRWGTLPAYEFIGGAQVPGHYYYKNL